MNVKMIMKWSLIVLVCFFLVLGALWALTIPPGPQGPRNIGGDDGPDPHLMFLLFD